MLAFSMAVFASLPVAKDVNQEMEVKQESTAAQEMMVKEIVTVQLAEMADSCWVPFEGVAEMPALMLDQ
jgi:hypothetical protein